MQILIAKEAFAHGTDADDSESFQVVQRPHSVSIPVNIHGPLEAQVRDGKIRERLSFFGLAERLEKVEFAGFEAPVRVTAGIGLAPDFQVHCPRNCVHQIRRVSAPATFGRDKSVGEAVSGDSNDQRLPLVKRTVDVSVQSHRHERKAEKETERDAAFAVTYGFRA
jgi:hypothetical protein